MLHADLRETAGRRHRKRLPEQPVQVGRAHPGGPGEFPDRNRLPVMTVQIAKRLNQRRMPGVQPDGGSRQLPDTPPQQFKQQIRIGDRIAAEQCRDVTEPVPDQAVLRGMDHLRKQLPLPAGIVEYDVLRMQVARNFPAGRDGPPPESGRYPPRDTDAAALRCCSRSCRAPHKPAPCRSAGAPAPGPAAGSSRHN